MSLDYQRPLIHANINTSYQPPPYQAAKLQSGAVAPVSSAGPQVSAGRLNGMIAES
jgi:hypothetical protein